MSLKPLAPQDIVVVGTSDDLSRCKLLPALYNLAASDLLPRQGSIIGLARSDLGDERFRKFARGSIEEFSRTGEPALVCTYSAGGWGPPEADELIAPRTWHLR